MSTTQTLNDDLARDLATFIEDYHREDLLKAINEPDEYPCLYLEASDLFRFDPVLLDDWLEQPKVLKNHAKAAVQDINLPYDLPKNLEVRLRDKDGYIDEITVPEVQRSNVGKLQGIKGQINQVTPEYPLLKEASYICELCGTTTRVPQSFYKKQMPHQCSACERQGPFRLDPDASDDTPYVQIQLKQPPEESGQGSGHDTTVHVVGDLCDFGGRNGIHDLMGERVSIYGVIDADDSDLENGNGPPIYEKTVHAESITLEEEIDVDYGEDLDLIKDLASGVDWDVPEYVEVEPDHPAWALAHSLAPGLKLDLRLAQVGLGTMAYLAGSYRMDGESTADYRGEIHMGAYGDPGTGKSTFATAASAMAPMSIRATGPDLSKVGLTAAAIKDDFGGDQWTLSPGILPKANGGHAIVEEIDKMDQGDTDALHDALEYPQRIDVSKAGISATLNTEAALFTTGNPVNGSFDRSGTIGEQIGINDALITRFDLIFCLWDRVDKKIDTSIADHILTSMSEASREQRSIDGMRSGFEAELAKTAVDIDLIPKWIAACRDLCKPELPEGGEAIELLKDWYVDTRQENGSDGTVPITARSLEAGVRVSIAMARLRFSEVVEPCDVRLAIHLSKRVMGDIFFDPATGEFDASRQYKPDQKTRRERVKKYVGDNPRCTISDIASDLNLTYDDVEHDIEHYKRKGDIYEPETDKLQRA